MAWTPLSRESLYSMIAAALTEYDEDVRAEWARIRIEPEKWHCSPWGDEGGGFWVVAIDDGKVLWFNDIEDGFNWSGFSERGTIREYACNQTELTEVLESIAQLQSARTRAGLRETGVPVELAGPGTIVRHQTTYWELRATAAVLYRVHFRDKVEFAFAGPGYPAVEVASRHPLLVQYDEPSGSLYFSGAPVAPHRVAETLERALLDASEGWRGLTSYAGSVDNVERLLRAGHGLLMSAPESICAAAAALLEGMGVSTSILGHAPAHLGKRVLLFGRSYVIASAFFFERRNSAA
jgi:hypothetical protein